MERLYKREIKDYSNDELTRNYQNSFKFTEEAIDEIADEMKKRGMNDMVEKIDKMHSKKRPIYSPYRNRVFANILDMIILSITGAVLGFNFSNWFSELGENGVFIGFIISLIYFGLQNSYLFNGQTIGKKALDIKVVDKNGEYLSLKASFLRTLILAVPYFFTNYINEFLMTAPFIMSLKYAILVSLSILIILYVLINRKSKQSIHDFAVSSFVINDSYYPKQKLVKHTPYIKILVPVIFCLILTTSVASSFNSAPLISELTTSMTEINKIKNIKCSGIHAKTRTISELSSNQSQTIKYLALNLNVSREIIENMTIDNMVSNEKIKEAVNKFLFNFSDSNSYQMIHVSVNNGYDIGIFRWNRSISSSGPISEWK